MAPDGVHGQPSSGKMGLVLTVRATRKLLDRFDLCQEFWTGL